MSERLHIVMPCARPENLEQIAQSIRGVEAHPFEVRWHVLLQGPEPDPFGVSKTNEAIDAIRDGWIWCFADDSLVHPSMFRRLGEILTEMPRAQAVVFSEQRNDFLGVLRAAPENVRIGAISGDQVVMRRELYGDRRYDYATHKHCCDGALLTEIYQATPAVFVFHDEVLVWFNRLTW